MRQKTFSPWDYKARGESLKKPCGFSRCGVVTEDNEDAKALSDAVVKPSDDCTGAMHQAAIGHVLYIHKHGWEKYVEKMTKNEGEKEAS